MASRIVWILLLVIGGGGLIVIIPLIVLGGIEFIVDMGVAKRFRIVHGNDLFEIWKKPPLPIYMKVCIFNITNPDDLKNGAKPVLQEVGPYVYLQTLEKVNISEVEVNDTVRYNQIYRYYFLPDMSEGRDDDLVTFINVPFVTVSARVHEFTDTGFILEAIDSILTTKGETLTRTHTVKEFLFDGFSVQAFLDLLNDPTIEGAGDGEIPETIRDGKMGFFKGKNGTSDGTLEVLRGNENVRDLTRIQTYNGKKDMNVWKHASCNAINGTDGMFFQPFLTKETKLELFIRQMCRSMQYVYAETLNHRGITAYEYKISDTLFQSVELNPDNWCFCPEKNTSSCTTNGIIRISLCFEGAPMILSQPHFLGGDPFLIEAVEGLNPDPSKHSGHLIMHPKTGATLEARHRFQFNVELKRRRGMPTFSKVSNVIHPIFWLETGANIDETNKGQMKWLDMSLVICSIVSWVLLVGCVMLVVGGGYLMTKYNRAKQFKNFQETLKDSGPAVTPVY